MLYTASFYAPETWVGKVYRVSRQHPRGRRTQWDVLPFCYPSRHLLQSYRNSEIDFTGFGEAYVRELEARHADSRELREWLDSVPHLGPFTLLCFEAQGKPCHRLLLAQWLLEKVPELELGELR